MFGTGINLSILLQLKEDVLHSSILTKYKPTVKRVKRPGSPLNTVFFEVSNGFPNNLYFLKKLSNRDFHVMLPIMFPSILDYSNQAGPLVRLGLQCLWFAGFRTSVLKDLVIESQFLAPVLSQATPQLPAHCADICGQSPAETSKFQERDSHAQVHKDKHLTRKTRHCGAQAVPDFAWGSRTAHNVFKAKQR